MMLEGVCIQKLKKETLYGPDNLAASHVYSWTGLHGAVLSIHEGLRQNLGKGSIIMLIYLTAVIAAFLFVYLIVAIARPERF